MTDRKPPWKTPKPKRGEPKKLTDAEKAMARERAEAHGRNYPNLVDNMWVIKQRQC